jgi:hypothetical protein
VSPVHPQQPLGEPGPSEAVAASCRWHDRVPRPRGLRGTRPPQWSRSCQSYPQASRANPKMDTDTHTDLTRECMHHTPRIPSGRACYTRASNRGWLEWGAYSARVLGARSIVWTCVGLGV